MADDNGSGNAGGNTSVVWTVRHGKQPGNPRRLTAINADAVALPPARGAAAAAGAPAGRFAGAAPAASAPAEATGPVHFAPRAHVLVTEDGVEGHTDHGYREIGGTEHPRRFRVRLRFKKELLDLVYPQDQKLLDAFGERDARGDIYLTVHVPAIERPEPAPGQAWADTPWEIHWEW